MNLSRLFKKCVFAKYTTIESTKCDYCIEQHGDRLFLLLQGSVQEEDWRTNFDFAVKPYHDMENTWKAHRGFVRNWKSLLPYIQQYLLDPSIKTITVIGYRHQAITK